jgi:hypothetical protein
MSKVRPPRWRSGGQKFDQPLTKKKQHEYLEKFRACESINDWDAVHSDHYDWWMFPIDDGRLDQFNLKSESDVDALVHDPEWMGNFRESVRIVALSMGWDLHGNAVCSSRRGVPFEVIKYHNKDVRLAKMIRSAWILGVEDVFESLQRFAHHINRIHYNGDGFWYGSINLDEILYMRLPRDRSFYIKYERVYCTQVYLRYFRVRCIQKLDNVGGWRKKSSISGLHSQSPGFLNVITSKYFRSSYPPRCPGLR